MPGSLPHDVNYALSVLLEQFDLPSGIMKAELLRGDERQPHRILVRVTDDFTDPYATRKLYLTIQEM